MRFRPFGASGAAISNLTLSFGSDALARGRESGLELIYSALEAGVNSYRLETADPVAAEVLGEALSHIDRKLICVSLMLGAETAPGAERRDFSAERLTGAIDRALHFSGLGWIDVATLHEPAEHELPLSALNALKALRATGRIRMLGIAGEGAVMDAYVSTGAFDLLATPLGINADWRIRSRIRTAREMDMSIFAYDVYSDRRKRPADAPLYKKGMFGFGGQKRPADSRQKDAFGFLYRTPNWTAEAICLSYALSDPSISSVIVRATDVAHLGVLAATPERDLPPGIAAQIEMARVTASAAA